MRRLTIASLSLGIGAYIGISLATYLSFGFVRYVPQVASLEPTESVLDFSEGQTKIMPDVQVQLANWTQPEDEFDHLYFNTQQVQPAVAVQGTIGVE